MAEFKISRIRYTWRGDWNTSIAYNRDDVIKYGGSSWVCIRQHTSSVFLTNQNFLANPNDTDFSPAWTRMTSGYVFRGSWNTATLYSVGDVVVYGGYLYLANAEHTASGDFESDSANWDTYLESVSWNTDWAISTDYGVGDVVKYGGIVYKCIDAHTSASTEADGLELDQNSWETYFEGVEFKGVWTIGTRYKKNDLVEHNGYLWRCKKANTPADDSTIIFDSDEFWSIELPGLEFNGNWSSTEQYTQGDVVRFGGNLYESLTDNYNSNPETTIENDWRLLLSGNRFAGIWSADSSYEIGDVVRRGGNLYVAQSNIVSDGSTLDYLDSGDWELLLTGQNFRGTWQDNTVYSVNDVVTFNHSTYICTVSHPSAVEPIANFPGDNGEGIVYWEILIQSASPVGMNNRGDLLTYDLFRSEIGDESSLGPADVNLGSEGQLLTINNESSVTYSDNSQIARVFHVDNTSGVDSLADPQRGLSPFKPWRTVRFACEQANDEFEGHTTVKVNTGTYVETLPIVVPPRTVVLGSELRSTTISPNVANSDLDGDYVYFVEGLQRIVEIVQNLVEASPLSPPKTPTNSLDPVEVTNYQAEDVRKFDVTVATGTLYDSELTGNVFYLNGVANPTLQLVRGETYTFVQYDESNTTHPFKLSTSITINEYSEGVFEDGVTSNNRYVTLTIPDDALSILYYYCETHGIEMGGQIDIVDEYSFVPITGSSSEITTTQNLLIDIENYIEFELGNGSTNPVTTGSNEEVEDELKQISNTIRILRANIDFLANEVIEYIKAVFPSYSPDEDFYKLKISRIINAIAYDLRYPGNYRSLLEARYYRNEVQGSLREDMFYCRDATGVRDCTLSGLTATLNPPGVFDLYQRPTGGAYISLDPGWGPADESTWIVNRSPYIQGVTTIGTACIGQKVDGALHNGGNKSIVSNDFTQVISDGIGAWVLNNARAELVSVFSYYAQVGYLAEDGGIIRATNGNCSYGAFGVIADGVDDTETPLTGSVFTQNNSAEISSFVTGGTTDEIIAVEFQNGGQNYTQATSQIVGAGNNAEAVFEDFRDNAIFDMKLLDADDNRAIDSIGGSGYRISQGNAQETGGDNSQSIVISATDNNEEAEYLGKRLIIISGPGTGQYGYVTGYNLISKEVSVSRESDDQPGWDHLVPGKDLAVFNNSTVYRIEPRVTISPPEYQSTAVDLQVNSTWSSITYGETTEVYTSVTGDPGTGDVEDQDGLAPVTATFDITKNGREYQVAINNAGLGYSEGDTITIEGTQVGGTSPYNDIEITVTATSNDSSNSIVSFTANGIGKSGRWVILPDSGTATLYSNDETAWASSNLPVSGQWTNIASGNNVFVAIQSDSSSIGSANPSDIAAYSLDGINWTQTTMPSQQVWSAVTHGDGIFVAVAKDDDAGAISTDGINWTATTLADFGDSTTNVWVDITYGKGQFVAVANSNNVSATGIYNADTSAIDWTADLMDVIADSAQVDWRSVAYGNNRFVAVSAEGFVGYSFDGETWKETDMLPTQDGSTQHVWNSMKYANGLFLAIGEIGGAVVSGDATNGESTFLAYSPDGISWSTEDLNTSGIFKDLAFGNPYVEQEDSSVGTNTPIWIVPGYNKDSANSVRIGKRALGRVTVSSGLIGQVKIWDPGSGYLESPTTTITDPTNTSNALVLNRLADGVIAGPSFINRGFGYRSDTTTFDINGDGFADVIPVGANVTLTNLDRFPEVGSQLKFAGLSELFNIIRIDNLGDLGYPTTGRSILVRIAPAIRVQDFIEHQTAITIRERIAQARITGHDFLDIGTGNFTETNYPELYQDYDFVAAPENEVREEEGGRVFYTSTDQEGNFRTGELFAVEQATGIVTVSSDFFDLAGLSELRLGGIRVGGSGTVVREFSTDPTLQADSNNIVPTQRAISTFLENRLSLGGSDIETNFITAGVITIGPNGIRHAGGPTRPIIVRNIVDIEGGINGSILAQTMFYASFNQDNDE